MINCRPGHTECQQSAFSNNLEQERGRNVLLQWFGLENIPNNEESILARCKIFKANNRKCKTQKESYVILFHGELIHLWCHYFVHLEFNKNSEINCEFVLNILCILSRISK